jgi:tRNA A37 threonylcarbamoyladenosine modification protein TsaB
MMLFVDGCEISVLTLVLADAHDDSFSVVYQETASCALGDELAVMQDFLQRHAVELSHIEAFGVVRGPGSAGALRSVLSLVNAAALALEKQVFSVVCESGVWKKTIQEHAYVLPIYDRPAHTTASFKDSLGRISS